MCVHQRQCVSIISLPVNVSCRSPSLPSLYSRVSLPSLRCLNELRPTATASYALH
jgi:hypothetical protein